MAVAVVSWQLLVISMERMFCLLCGILSLLWCMCFCFSHVVFWTTGVGLMTSASRSSIEPGCSSSSFATTSAVDDEHLFVQRHV